MTEVVVVVRDTPEGTLVSVCDPDCIGETYTDETRDLSLDVSPDFYAGDDAERLAPAEAMDRLAGAETANLVGETSVSAAVDAGIVNEDRVLEIDGTLHAQVVWM